MSGWSFLAFKSLPGLIMFALIAILGPQLGLPGYYMWLMLFNFVACMITLTIFTAKGAKSTGWDFLGISLFMAGLITVLFLLLDALVFQLPATFPIQAVGLNLGHVSVYFIDLFLLFPFVLIARRIGQGWFSYNNMRRGRVH